MQKYTAKIQKAVQEAILEEEMKKKAIEIEQDEL